MLCNNCNKREATVRYEENINGDKKKINLCRECSEKLGIFKKNIMDNIFFPFFDEVSSINESTYQELVCPKCGYSFSDYTKYGVLGCSNCYETFESKLSPIIYKLQGKKCHIKEDENQKVTVKKPKNDVERLQIKLDEAIKNEEYEKAAELRDRIREIKKEGDK